VCPPPPPPPPRRRRPTRGGRRASRPHCGGPSTAATAGGDNDDTSATTAGGAPPSATPLSWEMRGLADPRWQRAWRGRGRPPPGAHGWPPTPPPRALRTAGTAGRRSVHRLAVTRGGVGAWASGLPPPPAVGCWGQHPSKWSVGLPLHRHARSVAPPAPNAAMPRLLSSAAPLREIWSARPRAGWQVPAGIRGAAAPPHTRRRVVRLAL